MQLPLRLELDDDARYNRPPLTKMDPKHAEQLKYALVLRMKKKIRQHEEALVNQMVTGNYHPKKWPHIIRLEEEIERLKGALGMLRYLSGELDVLHLDMDGYLSLPGGADGQG